MSEKKLRISKEDLEGGKGEDKAEEKTVSIPAEDSAEKDKKKQGSKKGKVGKKAKAGPQDKTKGQKDPAGAKGKKGFRPKLKSPLAGKVGKGKKGAPTTKKGAGDGAAAPGPTAADQAQRGFIRRQHPMVLVGSGIALFAVCFAGTFLLIDVLKTDRQRSEETLEYSTKAMTEVQEGIVRAQKEELPYSYLQNLAEASEDLAGKVEGRKRSYEADVTDKPQLTEPTLAVIDADLEFLRSFASLATVKDARLRNRWRQIKRDMRNAIGTIEEETPRIQSEVSDDPSLIPSESSMDTSVASVNGIVLNAADALDAWFAQLRRIEVQCEQAKSFVSVATSLVAEYRAQRSDTDSALEQSPLRWDDAYDILEAEATRRDELASRFIGTQAPLLAQGSWTQMGQLVQESVRVLSAGAEGIGQEPFPSGRFWQGSNTKPAFDAESQQISSQIDSTDSVLQSEMAQAEDQTCNRKKPPRPAV